MYFRIYKFYRRQHELQSEYKQWKYIDFKRKKKGFEFA